MILSLLTIILSAFYAAFLLWCLYHWNKLGGAGELESLSVRVAVIVPMRNEEDNVEELLSALAKQRYTNFEIILADDHSTDATIAIAEKWIANHPEVKAKCIRSTGQSKKDAISLAIGITDAELIMTTDADCRMNEEWISAVVNHFSKSNSYLISSPVIMKSGRGSTGKIQSAEYAGLTAIGAAAISAGVPMYCSGANLAFSKKIFYEEGGYSGSKSSSGDDTQLMRKIADRWPGKITFLKDFRAAIETVASGSHTDLFEQRRRWASKIPATLSPFTVSIAVLAWLVHALLLILLFYSVSFSSFLPLILAFIIKVSAEIVLLSSSMKFMHQRIPLLQVIVAQPFYALYIVVVGAIAPFTKFKWKGRRGR